MSLTRAVFEASVYLLTFIPMLGFVQDVVAEAERFELKWSDNSPEEGHHVLDHLTIDATTGNILIVTKSVDSAFFTGAEIWLREVGRDGKLIRKSLIGTRAPEDKISLRPGTVAGVFSLPADELLVVGKLENDLEYVVRRYDGSRTQLASTTLEKKFRYCRFHESIRLADDQFVLVGNHATKAIAVAIDQNGQTVWSHYYSPRSVGTVTKDTTNTLTAAVSFDKGQSLLLAGLTGKLNKFAMGPSAVWLMRCTPDGQVQTEHTFPGRFPRLVGPLFNENIPLIYDKKGEIATQNELQAINADLATIWEKEVEMSTAWIDQPDIAQLNDDRFVVAGFVKKELRVREYDELGNATRSYEKPMEDGDVSVQIVGSDPIVVVGTTSFHNVPQMKPLKRWAVYGLAPATP